MCINVGVIVISMKNAPNDPVTLTFGFQPQNHVIYRIFQGHSPYQVWTLFDHSFLSCAADKQTNKQQTNEAERRTHSDRP